MKCRRFLSTFGFIEPGVGGRRQSEPCALFATARRVGVASPECSLNLEVTL